MTEKLKIINEKKIAELEESLNKKCETDKDTLTDSMNKMFEVERSQVTLDQQTACLDQIESAKEAIIDE